MQTRQKRTLSATEKNFLRKAQAGLSKTRRAKARKSPAYKAAQVYKGARNVLYKTTIKPAAKAGRKARKIYKRRK